MKQMKKSLLLVGIMACFAMLFFKLPASAADIVCEGTCNGSEDSNVTWALDSEGTLTFSGSGYMGNADSRYPGSYGLEFPISNVYEFQKKKSDVKKIVVGEGILNLPDYAFYSFDHLKEIELPSTVKMIGKSAFENCMSLKELTVPACEKIEIFDCKSLERLSIINYNDSSNVNISTLKIPNLKKIELPENVDTLSLRLETLFTDDYSLLESINVPGSIKNFKFVTYANRRNSIGLNENFSLNLNEGIEKVNITNGTDIEKIVIPSSVKDISLNNEKTDFYVPCTYSDLDFLLTKYGNDHSIIVTHNFDEGKITSEATYLNDGEKVFTCKSCEEVVKERIDKLILPPSEIQGITNTSSGIKLEWIKNKNASGYYIYRSINGGKYQKVANISKNSILKYTDKAAKKNGYRYDYKIVAVKKSGESAALSAESGVKSTVYLKGTSITTATNSTAKTIKLSWKKDDKATGYIIEYSTSSSFKGAKSITVSKKSTIGKNITKLTKGKTYYVRMCSYYKLGKEKCCSPWTKAVKVKITK